MTTLFEDPRRGPVEIAGSQLRSYDFSFRRLTDLSLSCPVCKQNPHYRCRDPQHPWNFTETHKERLPGYGSGDKGGGGGGGNGAGGADLPAAAPARGETRRSVDRYGRTRWG